MLCISHIILTHTTRAVRRAEKQCVLAPHPHVSSFPFTDPDVVQRPLRRGCEYMIHNPTC